MSLLHQKLLQQKVLKLCPRQYFPLRVEFWHRGHWKHLHENRGEDQNRVGTSMPEFTAEIQVHSGQTETDNPVIVIYSQCAKFKTLQEWSIEIHDRISWHFDQKYQGYWSQYRVPFLVLCLEYRNIFTTWWNNPRELVCACQETSQNRYRRHHQDDWESQRSS